MNPQDQTGDPAQLNDEGAAPAAPLPSSGGPVSSVPPTALPAPAENQQYTEVALPSAAEDTDLIEKEWVERAKQIVEHTREDPYEQQRALSQMKADYLKKRYNKDIKVSDD